MVPYRQDRLATDAPNLMADWLRRQMASGGLLIAPHQASAFQYMKFWQSHSDEPRIGRDAVSLFAPSRIAEHGRRLLAECGKSAEKSDNYG
jgi:hypothetical protein